MPGRRQRNGGDEAKEGGREGGKEGEELHESLEAKRRRALEGTYR